MSAATAQQQSNESPRWRAAAPLVASRARFIDGPAAAASSSALSPIAIMRQCRAAPRTWPPALYQLCRKKSAKQSRRSSFVLQTPSPGCVQRFVAGSSPPRPLAWQRRLASRQSYNLSTNRRAYPDAAVHSSLTSAASLPAAPRTRLSPLFEAISGRRRGERERRVVSVFCGQSRQTKCDESCAPIDHFFRS